MDMRKSAGNVVIFAVLLCTTPPAHAQSQHAGDVLVARTGTGQLTYGYAESARVIVAHLLPTQPFFGWQQGSNTGFQALAGDRPEQDLFMLEAGVQVGLQIIALDEGVQAYLPAFPNPVRYLPGDVMPLGGAALHTHPIWFVDAAVVGNDWDGVLTGLFRFVDSGSTGYADSDEFVIYFTNRTAPAVCGDVLTQYLEADLNVDCYVEWADFGVFAGQWQQSNCQEPDWCSGADMNYDGTVEWADFGVFAGQWQQCTDPDNDICN